MSTCKDRELDMDNMMCERTFSRFRFAIIDSGSSTSLSHQALHKPKCRRWRLNERSSISVSEYSKAVWHIAEIIADSFPLPRQHVLSSSAF